MGQPSYTYNAQGRAITAGGSTISYDAFNREVELQTTNGYTQFVYAPDGFKFAYMHGQSVAKYVAPLTAGLQAVYTAALPAPPAFWRHSDWLGTVHLDSTPAQTVYFDGGWAPFGETYAGMGTSDRSFTGQTQDTGVGLYDFLFRQYSPTQGRWIVPDPAGLAAVDITNPQTWNRYAYVMNNPLSYVDPLGLYLMVCPEQKGCPVGGYSDAGAMGTWGMGAFNDVFGYNDPYQDNMWVTEDITGFTLSVTVSSTFQTGKFNLTNPFTKPKQTFSQCMAAHANDFSIAGALNHGFNAAFGTRSLAFQNNWFAQAVLGNPITTLAYGSLADNAGTAGSMAPTFVQMGMGTAVSYGRRTTTIMALNLAGEGGVPLALGAASAGTKAVIGGVADVAGGFISLPANLTINAGFSLAEAAYCQSQQ